MKTTTQEPKALRIGKKHAMKPIKDYGEVERVNKGMIVRWEVPKRESSNIDKFSYSEEHVILVIKFKNGNIYSYEKVPKEVYAELESTNNSTESLGSWLSKNIVQKKDQYPSKRENV